jgi:hypothetical protein
MIRNLWSSLQAPMVQDVPDALAAREAGVRTPDCRRGHWARGLCRRCAQTLARLRPLARPARPGLRLGDREDWGPA